MMTHVGDLSRALVLQARQAEIKNRLAELTEEMTTGVKADPAKSLNGDLTRVAALETDLSRVSAYLLANTEAELVSGSMQRVLQDVQDISEDLGLDLLNADFAMSSSGRDALAISAREAFNSIASGLNTKVAGRSLFSGNATDQAALIAPDDFLSSIKAALIGAVTVEDFSNRLDAYFDTPGGDFESATYLGSTDGLAPISLNRTETVRLNIHADQPVFRNVLKNAAAAALATDPDIGLDIVAQEAILVKSGSALIEGQTELTDVRSSLGAVQERIAKAIGRNETGQSALQMARNGLISADPYATATALEQVQSQLEALYTISARNSRLSLVNYLR